MEEQRVQEDPNSCTVLVTNISPSATSKSVADFFAFCGTISSLTMRVQQDSEEKVQEAIIEFKQEAATKTALLLTNALIIDRPISVARYQGEAPRSEEQQKALNTRVFKEDEIENKPLEVSAAQRSQTSVIASIIASGYQLATGTLESAKAYDEKHSITAQLKAGAEEAVNTVVAKATEIDSQYKISETTTAWAQAASNKITEVDKRYGISDSANAFAHSAESLVKSVEVSAPVVAASEALKNTGAAVASYADYLTKEATRVIEEKPTLKAASDTIIGTTTKVKDEYNAVVEETNRLIKEQDEQKETSSTTTTSTGNDVVISSEAINPSDVTAEKGEETEEKKSS